MTDFYNDFNDDQDTGWQEPPIDLTDAETLSLSSFRRHPFIIHEMLTPGLCVLAGAPKLGKSWLVLDMCQHIAQGKPLWGIDTTQGSVMYIALEDSKARLQDRLLTITDEPSPHLLIATSCRSLGEGLEEEVTYFVNRYPDAKLVVIDTFQMVRMRGRELSYSNDYSETSHLKQLADRLKICILLVHHTRKMGDSDTLNEISGTNGIAGCADTLMVLKKPKRTDNKATLYCTGRDIRDRELELELDRETCRWKHVSGSLPKKAALPSEIDRIWEMMREIGRFDGGNSEFAERFSSFCKTSVTPSLLKRIMNKHRSELEDRGVTFISLKTNKGRLLSVIYSEKYDLKQNPPLQPDTEAETPVTAPDTAGTSAQPETKGELPAATAIADPPAPPDADDSSDGDVCGYSRSAAYYEEYDSCARDFDHYDGYILPV